MVDPNSSAATLSTKISSRYLSMPSSTGSLRRTRVLMLQL